MTPYCLTLKRNLLCFTTLLRNRGGIPMSVLALFFAPKGLKILAGGKAFNPPKAG